MLVLVLRLMVGLILRPRVSPSMVTGVGRWERPVLATLPIPTGGVDGLGIMGGTRVRTRTMPPPMCSRLPRDVRRCVRLRC